MQKTEKQDISINLLRLQQKGFFDRFLSWAFTTGRAIIIFTETIALAAFLYRFTLDYQLVDLHDKIEGQQFIVVASSQNEAKYRDVQKRLSLAKTTIEEGVKTPQLLSDIVLMATGKVSFTSVSLSNKKLKLDFSSRSLGNLQAFVSELRSSKAIQSVEVESILNKPLSATVSMTVTAMLK